MELSIDLLLQKRDYDSQAFTKKIIETFSEKLTKTVHMLYKLDRDIKWHTVERFKPVVGFICIVGTVDVHVGDTINTPEGAVLLTPDNIADHHHNVSYLINSNILQHGTVEELYQHVVLVESIIREATTEEIIHVLKTGAASQVEVVANPAVSGIVERITRPSNFEGFDTSGLTEAQYITLRACAQTGKGKNFN
jgi:hypothetical protein